MVEGFGKYNSETSHHVKEIMILKQFIDTYEGSEKKALLDADDKIFATAV